MLNMIKLEVDIMEETTSSFKACFNIVYNIKGFSSGIGSYYFDQSGSVVTFMILEVILMASSNKPTRTSRVPNYFTML